MEELCVIPACHAEALAKVGASGDPCIYNPWLNSCVVYLFDVDPRFRGDDKWCAGMTSGAWGWQVVCGDDRWCVGMTGGVWG